MANNLYPEAQTSYREFHSTETTLLRVKHDILMNMNQQHATLLVLPDLNAAFDTVDHDILLKRLQCMFGISGRAWMWFQSYCTCTTAHSQYMYMEQHLNGSTCNMVCSRNPLLFIMYASELFSVVENHLPIVHAMLMTPNFMFHSRLMRTLVNLQQLLPCSAVLTT